MIRFLRNSFLKWNTTRIIVVGFAALILFGALLLTLPIMSANGKWTSFVDALFTAATSVCVTGLVTVNLASHFSLLGKLVILLLAQLGGFGVITVTMMLFLLIAKRITLKERRIIEESYGLTDINNMPEVILKVVRGALITEGIGAVLFSFRFISDFGPLRGIWYAVFHAVSAFCNAGLDILGDSSFQMYVNDPLVNFTTIFLIFMGNIGFVVWWDIGDMVKKLVKKKVHPNRTFSGLKLHSKIALTMSALIYMVPVILMLLIEYRNPDTIGNMSFGNKVMSCMFQAATLRTAGFETISQQAFRPATTLMNIILMFIGGSPAGTAGGTKTVTIAVLFFALISQVKGRKDAEAFGRKIPHNIVMTALSVTFMNLLIVFSFTMILLVTEGRDLTSTLFEVTSAVATTGLSMGLSGVLSTVGKILITFCMYLGRIGPITLSLALYFSRSVSSQAEYAEGKVLIG